MQTFIEVIDAIKIATRDIFNKMHAKVYWLWLTFIDL